jgi:hypothetical protein
MRKKHSYIRFVYRARSTESFRAVAGVKRSRVRAGIFDCSPVAALRLMRALSLHLRNTPSPAGGKALVLPEALEVVAISFSRVLLSTLPHEEEPGR